MKGSAENNDKEAQDLLGLIYADGEGVSVDLMKAYKWLTLSASVNNKALPHIGALSKKCPPMKSPKPRDWLKSGWRSKSRTDYHLAEDN